MDDSTVFAASRSKPVDPHSEGLYRRFTVYNGSDGGALINTRLWNEAAENGEYVGTCRFCGHDLLPKPTETVGQLLWYTADCVNFQCGRSIAAPRGEMLRRSARHSEMPAGFWEKRTGKASR